MQLPCAESGSHLTEVRIAHKIINRTEIDMVQHIQEIEAELQGALFTEPTNMIVFQYAGINLNESRVSVSVSLQISLGSRGRRGEISSGEQSIHIG